MGKERLNVKETPEWRAELRRLRGMTVEQADRIFAEFGYEQEYMRHLESSAASAVSNRWLRDQLVCLMHPDLTIVDMGCGLNRLANLPCHVIGLDRFERPGQLCGKMEAPPIGDKVADVIIYSLSLYGSANDIAAYFAQAARILRSGGHLFVVEPASEFSPGGIVQFLEGLHDLGFLLKGHIVDVQGDEVHLKALQLTLDGQVGKTDPGKFRRR